MTLSVRREELRAAWPSEAEVRESVLADAAVRGAGKRGVLWGAAAVLATLLWAIPFALLHDVSVRSWGASFLAVLFTVITFVLVLFAVVCVLIALWEFARPRREVRRATLHAYADALGLDFLERDRAVRRRGIFFGEPDTERGYLGDAYRGDFCIADDTIDQRAKRLRIGIAKPQLGKRPYGPYRRFRYLAIRLPGPVPHLVLRSHTGTRGVAAVQRAQRVSLEGHFDRFFDTYAPEGLHRDALEILTPDVMAHLIDHAGDWDIELIDDTLHVISTRHRVRDDRDEVSDMLVFTETVSASVLRQSLSYSRSRTAPQEATGSATQRANRPRLQWFAFDAGALLSAAFLVAGLGAVFVTL